MGMNLEEVKSTVLYRYKMTLPFNVIGIHHGPVISLRSECLRLRTLRSAFGHAHLLTTHGKSDNTEHLCDMQFFGQDSILCPTVMHDFRNA